MHLDQFGILEYRIRRLEIVQEIIRDARACSSVYAKAGLTRGVFERFLEEDVARKSLPGFLLLIAKHHRQDLRILERMKAHSRVGKDHATLEDKIISTQRLLASTEQSAAMLAANESAASESLQIYHSIKKSSKIEPVAKSVYTEEAFRMFYADYAAFSPFVHGGHRETLAVTKDRDQRPVMLATLEKILEQLHTNTDEMLNELRAIHAQQE